MRQGILNFAPFPELSSEMIDSIERLAKSLESESAESSRGELEAKLDLLVARAFGLDMNDVKVIMETFHKTWDPSDHLLRMSQLP